MTHLICPEKMNKYQFTHPDKSGFANFFDFRDLIPYRRRLLEFQLFGVLQHLPFEGGDEFLALGGHEDVVGSLEDLDGNYDVARKTLLSAGYTESMIFKGRKDGKAAWEAEKL